MRKTALLVATLALAGCALRPRYADLVDPATAGKNVLLQLVEAASGQPVPGATIELGEYRSKLSLKTDAQGLFDLPVDKRYFQDNAIVVINAPVGVGRTQIVPAPVSPRPGTEEKAPLVAAPVELDAGS